MHASAEEVGGGGIWDGLLRVRTCQLRCAVAAADTRGHLATAPPCAGARERTHLSIGVCVCTATLQWPSAQAQRQDGQPVRGIDFGGRRLANIRFCRMRLRAVQGYRLQSVDVHVGFPRGLLTADGVKDGLVAKN
ncbi:hypothetical protein AAHC03_024223 [Spirometra sp. Aus1]